MRSEDFSPYIYFNHLVGLWWLIALASIMGGIFGFIFHQLHRPIYEATATYIVTIDLERFPIHDIREDMLQYNEDMALNTTKAVLLLPEVRDAVIAHLASQGLTISPDELVKNYTIERKHDIWELRYRSGDPLVAQAVANVWADIGYQAMLDRQASGAAPDYVVFQAPSPAPLPHEPVIYDRNRLVLAGITIGFLVGILITSTLSRSYRRTTSAV